jgi:hypothetical protein
MGLMPQPQNWRFCLDVGVANANPLDWLPGAATATAAAEIGTWAPCSNFDAVTVVADEPEVGHGVTQPAPIWPASGW